eukprot:351314-Rhodomonas_salina.1
MWVCGTSCSPTQTLGGRDATRRRCERGKGGGREGGMGGTEGGEGRRVYQAAAVQRVMLDCYCGYIVGSTWTSYPLYPSTKHELRSETDAIVLFRAQFLDEAWRLMDERGYKVTCAVYPPPRTDVGPYAIAVQSCAMLLSTRSGCSAAALYWCSRGSKRGTWYCGT